MEGSITQLGLSNYLINNRNNKISFFKHSYYNYSNFVFDNRRIEFNNTSRFGDTNSWRIDQSNYGDLISNIILEIELPDISAITTTTGHNIGYCNAIGHALIENIELRINNELIDAHNSVFRDIWSELTIPAGQQKNYKNIVKKFDNFSSTSFQGGKLYIPLLFWFCQYNNDKDSSLIFPIAAFYNQTIELFIKYAPVLNCIVSDDNSMPANATVLPNIVSAKLLVDYITIEEEERRALQTGNLKSFLMAQTSFIKYNISAGTTNTVLSLKQINYLVSELLLVVRRTDAAATPINDYFNYSDTLSLVNPKSPIKKITLKFDGRDKFTDIPAEYFYRVVPLKCHSNMDENSFINCISFSLHPEKLEQPDGACNFSEIQDPLLILDFENGLPSMEILIFSINYNMLENKDGCVSLLHSMSKSIPSKVSRIGNIMKD